MARGAIGRHSERNMVNKKFGLFGALIVGLAACSNSGIWPRQPAIHADIQTFQSQILRCWSVPPNAPSFVIALRVRLNANGTVIGQPLLLNPDSREVDETNFRLATQAAMNAVMQCGPYDLPPETYRVWSDVVIYMNPADAGRQT